MRKSEGSAVKQAVQQRSQKTQKRFIEAVLTLSKKHPMHLVTSKKISTEVGTAWGSAQYLFGNKESLFSESIRYASNQFLEQCETELTRVDYNREDLQSLISFMWKAANKSNAILNHEIAIACLHDEEITEKNREIISNSATKVLCLVLDATKNLYPNTSMQSIEDILLLNETFFTGLHFRRNFTRPKVLDKKLETMERLWRAALVDLID